MFQKPRPHRSVKNNLELYNNNLLIKQAET